GQDHLDGGLAILASGDGTHRDSAAVVGHAAAPVGEQLDHDLGAEPCERLVDGVVHHLVDQVVKAARTGATYVHAGAFADGIEALEDGDVLLGVLRLDPFSRHALPPLGAVHSGAL